MTVRIYDSMGRFLKTETVDAADPVAALAVVTLQNPGCTCFPQASDAATDDRKQRAPVWSPIRVIG